MLRNIEEKLAEEILDKYSGNDNYDNETLAYDIVGDAFEKMARVRRYDLSARTRAKEKMREELKSAKIPGSALGAIKAHPLRSAGIGAGIAGAAVGGTLAAKHILNKVRNNQPLTDEEAAVLDNETLAYDVIGDPLEKVARVRRIARSPRSVTSSLAEKDVRNAVYEANMNKRLAATRRIQAAKAQAAAATEAAANSPSRLSSIAKIPGNALGAIKAHPFRSAAIGAGAAGAAVGGTLAVKHILNKVQNNQPLTDEEAAVLADKTASEAYAVADYAINKMAAAEEFYADGQADMEASLEVLAEYGFLDEYGLNKEAAEESYETIDFVNDAIDVYNDGAEKMAAAEHCYDEGEIELTAAVQVLDDLGYSLD